MIDGSIAPPMFGYHPAPANANSTAPGMSTGDQWGSMIVVGPRSFIAAQIAGTYNIYREIRRHPTVAIAMTGIRALLKAADWTVEVDDDVPDEVTELIEETFVRRKNGLLNDVFTALEFGFAGFEKIWGKTEDGYKTIVDFKPLLADVTAPVVDEKTGVLVGLDNQGVRLGLMKSWLFTYGGEARNPWGEPIYENIRETAWKSWNDTAKKCEQYTTKAAGVVPIIKAAMGRGRDETGTERDINQQMEDVLEHLGDGKGVIWPIWCPEWMQRLLQAQPGLADQLLPEIKLLEVAPGHGSEFVEMFVYWDKLIVRGLLFPERALLEGVHGNKADATKHGDTGVTNCMQILGEILESLSRGGVDDVLEANWPGKYKGKVRLVAVALDDAETQAFRVLFEKIITNPLSYELATRLVELDGVVDGTGYPKAKQILNPVGEAVSPDDPSTPPPTYPKPDPLGCQSERSSSAPGSATRHEGTMAMPAATSDGEFAAMMAMHHTGAIEMGRYEAQNGSRADVRAMATKMADVQTAEKPKLEAIARDAGHGRMQPDPMMQEHSMKDMQALRAARGAEVDRVFLVHMIDHHENGVKMARAAMPNLKRDDLRRMAQMMIDDQTREVAQMRSMLNPAAALADNPAPDPKAQALAMAQMYHRVLRTLALAAHKFSSTQIEAPSDIASEVLGLAASIPDDALAEDGREARPHVTVRYGLHTADPAEVAKVLAGAGPVTAKLGPAKVFPPTAGHAFDVVVLSVESDGLRALNEKLGALENTNKYPEYVPHMTLAYVKPGRGAEFTAAAGGLAGREFTVDAVTFSDQAGKETVIKLGK